MTSLIDPQDSVSSLADIMGEGKKYKTEADVRKAIDEKDAFIAQLIKEARERDTEINKRMTAEELYRQMQNSRNQSNDASNHQTNEGEQSAMNRDSAPIVKAPDPDQIKNLVREALTQESTQASRNRNLTEVKNVLLTQVGDNYASMLTQKARELGMNINELDDLAARSPQAFLTLVGLKNETPNNPASVGVPPTSSRGGIPTQNSTARNEKYYNEMLKKDPRRFYSAENMAQRWKDIKELGAKYNE